MRAQHLLAFAIGALIVSIIGLIHGTYEEDHPVERRVPGPASVCSAACNPARGTPIPPDAKYTYTCVCAPLPQGSAR